MKNKTKFTIGLVILSILSMFFLFWYQNGGGLKVVSTIPENESVVNINNPVILITFNKPLSAKEVTEIQFETTPVVELRQVWDQADQVSLVAANPNELVAGITIAVKFRSSTIYTLTLKPPFEAEYAEDLRQQGFQDYQFGQDLSRIHEELPFVAKLPISTANYVIVYDYDQQAIRIRILKGTQADWQTEINQELTRIGVGASIKKIYLTP